MNYLPHRRTDQLPAEHQKLSGKSPTVSAECSGRADYPMTRDQAGDRIAPDSAANGPGGRGISDLPGQCTVSRQTSSRNPEQVSPHIELKRRSFQMQTNRI